VESARAEEAEAEREMAVVREHADRMAAAPHPGGLGGPGEGLPVTRDLLAGARLEAVARPPELVWEFTGERFTLTVRGEPAPRLLLDTLAGPGKTATRFEGRWRVSTNGRSLELLEVKADGAPAAGFAGLLLRQAGPARVVVADQEYNLLPGHRPPAKQE
jgi:hypothetical protein